MLRTLDGPGHVLLRNDAFCEFTPSFMNLVLGTPNTPPCLQVTLNPLSY
jgi:hypothetical protein